jgi:outer membrane lipoprotein LolB
MIWVQAGKRMQRWCGLGLLTLLMSACATPSASNAPSQTYSPPAVSSAETQVASVQADVPVPAFRAGRFALQVDSQPPQSFMTSFDLTGGWPEGTLNIYNPFGMQMARVEWTAQSARLRQGNQVREAASLESLVYQLTGTQLPTTALVDWLGGKPTPAEGWNVDVSEWHLRRLVLERVQPAPRTVLRIAFES